jgi:hypothetical protein
MTAAVISRETIARQAERAAQWAVQNPQHGKPPNPYDDYLEPEHHREWKASFERFMQAQMVDSEGGAL